MSMVIDLTVDADSGKAADVSAEFSSQLDGYIGASLTLTRRLEFEQIESGSGTRAIAQNTSAWFAAREGKLTASRFGVVCGLSKYAGPQALWQLLTKRVSEEQTGAPQLICDHLDVTDLTMPSRGVHVSRRRRKHQPRSPECGFVDINLTLTLRTAMALTR